jgi:hypothetical protein
MRYYPNPALAAVLATLVALAALVADIGTYWP